MKNLSNVKEKIVDATTELIQQSSGNIDDITTRQIAQKANVGIGLINYHFQSKENLISICVQRIIQNIVLSFSPDDENYQSDKERLTDWAIQVFDFLFENSAISRISILGDLFDYSMDSNSIKTQKGFILAMKNDVEESDKKIISFILTSVMQTAFLSKQISKEMLGYDFNVNLNRKAFITRLVSVLFDKLKKN